MEVCSAVLKIEEVEVSVDTIVVYVVSIVVMVAVSISVLVVVELTTTVEMGPTVVIVVFERTVNVELCWYQCRSDRTGLS